MVINNPTRYIDFQDWDCSCPKCKDANPTRDPRNPYFPSNRPRLYAMRSVRFVVPTVPEAAVIVLQCTNCLALLTMFCRFSFEDSELPPEVSQRIIIRDIHGSGPKNAFYFDFN